MRATSGASIVRDVNIVLSIVVAGSLVGFALTPLATAAEYVLDRAQTVQVGGQNLALNPGQALNVIGSLNGNATVRLVLPNGTVGIAAVPMTSMHLKPAATATAATAPSVPAVAPVGNGTPVNRVPTPTAVVAGSPKTAQASLGLSPGWTTQKLDALPAPAHKPKGFDYQFDPSKETFEIYVPRGYDPKKPCGVVGWTNAGDGHDIPHQFEPLFDEYQLIAIAAERCGNAQESERRVGLLVSAILQLSKTMAIDQRRLMLSGFSGGGRVSALGAFVHPEIFCGAISWCGGNFYKDYPDFSKANTVTYGFTHGEKHSYSATQLGLAKKNVKFVLLTGSKDFNLHNSQDIETAMKREHFQVQLIEQPELGHAVGSADNMRRALGFVLGARP